MSSNATTDPRTRKQAAIDRATSKAHEQARAGNLPTLLRTFGTDFDTRQTWNVNSRVTAGQTYLIDLVADCDGIRTLCTCDAAHADRICWHRAAVRLAALGELAHHTTRQPTVAVDPWPADTDDAEAFAAVS